MLDVEFFGNKFYNSNKNTLLALTYSDCIVDGKFKSLEEFVEIGLPFTTAIWMRLRSAILWAKKKIFGYGYGCNPSNATPID